MLRKQTSEETAFLDELYPEIEMEVKRQIDSMQELDDKEDPNFSDTDYLLAAYAASLRVLTSYRKIEDIDVNYELSRSRRPGEESPVEKIINEAVKIAYDYLTPKGFDSYFWKMLIPEERFYIKGLDLEKSGIYQLGAYQELAKGFGVREYRDLLASTKANHARLKTATEFGMRMLGGNDRFSNSLLRNVFAALHQAVKAEDTAAGRNWLRNELSSYWNQRNVIVEILNYIASLEHIENMSHWKAEARYARLLAELVKTTGCKKSEEEDLMAIPSFQDFMLPMLELMRDGEPHKMLDIKEKLAEYFNLSEEEKKMRLPSGKQVVYKFRIGWAQNLFILRRVN